MKALILAVLTVNFLSFWYSMRFFRDGGVSRLAMAALILSAPWIWGMSLLAPVIENPNQGFFEMGSAAVADGALVIVELATLIMFWRLSYIAKAAQLTLAFSPDLPRKLLHKGPYQYVRHPFYTVYLVSYLSVAVRYGSVWVAAPSAFAVAFYYQAARTEENKFARSPLAEDYARYKAMTGMFFPRIFKKQLPPHAAAEQTESQQQSPTQRRTG